MGASRDYHTKWNESEKNNTIWYHLYGESKKWYKLLYLQISRLTDTENQLMVAKGEGAGRDKLEVQD